VGVLQGARDLLESECRIELVCVGTVCSQSNGLKPRPCVLENRRDQSFSDTTSSMGGRNVKMTEPANGVVKKRISIEPANASKGVVQASQEKCLSGKGEAIGPAPPVIGKALHAPEAFSQALGNQLIEIERQLVNTLNLQRRFHCSPAQRTAVQQRPHQQNGRQQVATSSGEAETAATRCG
jgi:hypothetical protein